MLYHLIIYMDAGGNARAIGSANTPWQSVSDQAFVQSLEVKRTVNAGDDIKLGSACAASFSAKIITPGGTLSIPLSENNLVRVMSFDDTALNPTTEGFFYLTKPERTSSNTYRISGYDSVSKLDVDLASWLNAQTGWPYSLANFTGMVCAKCGLTLYANISSTLAATVSIKKFSAQAITGRQLMQYLAEIYAGYLVSQSGSAVRLDWYSSAGVAIGPQDGAGTVAYRSNSLFYADYAVPGIDRVALLNTDGTVTDYYDRSYTGDPSELNTYTIQNNVVLDAISAEHKALILENMYNRLHTFTYTPCKVSVWRRSGILAGHIVDVTDANGHSFTTIVMDQSLSGVEMLESTGSASRDTPEAVYSKDYQEQQQMGLSSELLAQMIEDVLIDELSGKIACRFG